MTIMAMLPEALMFTVLTEAIGYMKLNLSLRTDKSGIYLGGRFPYGAMFA